VRTLDDMIQTVHVLWVLDGGATTLVEIEGVFRTAEAAEAADKKSRNHPMTEVHESRGIVVGDQVVLVTSQIQTING
jgi:hypothetical protein